MFACSFGNCCCAAHVHPVQFGQGKTATLLLYCTIMPLCRHPSCVSAPHRFSKCILSTAFSFLPSVALRSGLCRLTFPQVLPVHGGNLGLFGRLGACHVYQHVFAASLPLPKSFLREEMPAAAIAYYCRSRFRSKCETMVGRQCWVTFFHAAIAISMPVRQKKRVLSVFVAGWKGDLPLA